MTTNSKLCPIILYFTNKNFESFGRNFPVSREEDFESIPNDQFLIGTVYDVGKHKRHLSATLLWFDLAKLSFRIQVDHNSFDGIEI